MLTSEGASLSVLTSLHCGMRGNRTATAAVRSQTGFEDRPGHQAHAFLTSRDLPANHVFPHIIRPPPFYRAAHVVSLSFSLSEEILFSSWVLQDHRYEMVDAGVWRQVRDEARESPVRFLTHPSIGSGGSQKAFSWL